MKKVAILIPVHNRLSYTQKCLRSLSNEIEHINSTDIGFKIIVIDDGSTDGSSEFITQNYPDVILLHGNGSLWWSGAINKGAKYALKELDSDYVLLWNNDINTNPEYFENIVKIILSKDDKTIIGSKIYRDDYSNIIWSAGGIFNPKTGNKYMIGMNKKDTKEFNNIIECDWLTGMGTLIHRNVIEKIGYWNNELFPQYYGDCDFTYRAKLGGFKITVSPELKIWNDTISSGLKHQNKIKYMISSLYDIKSIYNIKDNFNFYRLYSESIFAYKALLVMYFKYIGGFIKWKLLGLLAINRKRKLD